MKFILKASIYLAFASLFLSFYQQEPPPTDFLMAASIGLLGLYFLLKKKIPENDWVDRFAIAFLLLNFFQLSLTFNEKNAFWVAVTTFLILAYLALRYLATVKSSWFFFKAYLAAALINLGLMSVAFISLYSFGYNFDKMTQFGRAQGLFKDPNVAGPFLIPALIFFVDDSIQRPRFWKLLASGALFAGVFSSFSRGALVALTIALVLWMFLRRREIISNWKKYGLVWINLAAWLVIIFSYSPFYNLAIQRFRPVQGYDVQSRSVSWEAGVEGFSENPAGSGPGTFESGVLESQKETIREKIASSNFSAEEKLVLLAELETEKATEVAAKVGVKVTPSAHNTYLRVLRENGIIGITLFLAFIAGVLWKSGVLFRKKFKLESYQIAMFAAWVGFLANSMFIDTLHWRLIWYLPALLLASLELRRGKD